jgi:hypothetical protein
LPRQERGPHRARNDRCIQSAHSSARLISALGSSAAIGLHGLSPGAIQTNPYLSQVKVDLSQDLPANVNPRGDRAPFLFTKDDHFVPQTKDNLVVDAPSTECCTSC